MLDVLALEGAVPARHVSRRGSGREDALDAFDAAEGETGSLALRLCTERATEVLFPRANGSDRVLGGPELLPEEGKGNKRSAQNGSAQERVIRQVPNRFLPAVVME